MDELKMLEQARAIARSRSTRREIEVKKLIAIVTNRSERIDWLSY
jgi:hypothetical protein